MIILLSEENNASQATGMNRTNANTTEHSLCKGKHEFSPLQRADCCKGSCLYNGYSADDHCGTKKTLVLKQRKNARNFMQACIPMVCTREAAWTECMRTP